jgi:hypothetical protein
MHSTRGVAPAEAQGIEPLVDLGRYPLARLGSPHGRALVAAKRRDLSECGACSLNGFLRPAAVRACVSEIEPLMESCSFRHAQEHNIYFAKSCDKGAATRGLLDKTLTTSNHTLTCDQLGGTTIRRVYEWPALCVLLAQILDKPALFAMADPLARLNVMGYGQGDRIGWHFDRAAFTVTILLQEAETGGIFEYRRNLRSRGRPNHDGVARLLAGEDTGVRQLLLAPGTLNVFIGHRSAHRITPVGGARKRLIAILSFTQEPEVMFSADDRKQFYGRAEPVTGRTLSK